MNAVLAGSELYQVPLPDSEQIAFTPTRGGLPVFHGKTYEDHRDAWIHVRESMDRRRWALGSIAASLIKKHGDGAVNKFAKEVGYSKTRIYDLAKTYRTFKNSQRWEILPFHHYTTAAESADPEAAITKAEAGGWSSRELERYVETGLEPGETSDISAESIAKAALAVPADVEIDEDRAMMDHLLEAQAVVNALKAKCPRPQFVSDVYDGWTEEIEEYLEQCALASLKERVVAALRAGKCVESEIAAHARIPKNEIHAVMKAYEREKIFEKIKRRKTKTAKGRHPWIWHLVGEPIGNDFEQVRSVYHDPNMGGNSEWE